MTILPAISVRCSYTKSTGTLPPFPPKSKCPPPIHIKTITTCPFCSSSSRFSPSSAFKPVYLACVGSEEAVKMEDYLQYMKTLRSQMNDVEDQAAKSSVEEQMHSTTIITLEKDLDLAKSEIMRLKDETDKMSKAKGQICSQILEKQRKMASLESDSSTLSQTLELMQQEKLTLSAKFLEKRAYYVKAAEEISLQLKQREDWINVRNMGSLTGQDGLIYSSTDQSPIRTQVMPKAGEQEIREIADGSIKVNLDVAKAKREQLIQLKSDLVLENTKMRQSVELVRGKINDFKPELREMDRKCLEEELQALLSDKTAENEYIQSLELQLEKLKEISHTVQCSCGEIYCVKLDACA